MSNEYFCKFCNRGFGNYRKKKKHEKKCGISRLTEFGIEETAFNKIRNFDTPNASSSKQLQLGDRVEGSCPSCGTRLTSDDSYKGLDAYLECPECENVVNKNML